MAKLPELTTEEIKLTHDGKWISAVKSFRDRTGCSLTEGKAAIEAVVPNYRDYEHKPKVAKTVLTPDFDPEERIGITIRTGNHHADYEKGTITVFLPAAKLSPEEWRMLEKLFPTQRENVIHLLNVELLVAAIVRG